MTRTLLSAFMALLLLAVPATAFETKASSAFILDQMTGTVLLAKNADTPLPPASMSKLMTLYMAFEAVRDGRLSLDEKLRVSEHAMSYKGSSMYLNTRDRVTVADLLRGIIVLSGNDACAVIAEALSPDGTEAGFAAAMTRRAQQLGMTNSKFSNSNGWPSPGQRMSMRDLALLANLLITEFPEFYPMFAETEFAFDNRVPSNTRNRNPLLKLGIGADGLKTGHTQEAGYGLVGSAKQGDRRVIFVISGLDSDRARADEAEAIVNWSFRQFAIHKVARKDQVISESAVWMGASDRVALVPEADVAVLLPVVGGKSVKAEVVFNTPQEAPIVKGQKLGELVVQPEGMEETRVALVAANDVARGGFVKKIRTAAQILIARLAPAPEGAL